MPGHVAERDQGAGAGTDANHFAVDDIEQIRRGLKQLGRDVDGFGANFHRRKARRLARHDGYA